MSVDGKLGIRVGPRQKRGWPDFEKLGSEIRQRGPDSPRQPLRPVGAALGVGVGRVGGVVQVRPDRDFPQFPLKQFGGFQRNEKRVRPLGQSPRPRSRAGNPGLDLGKHRLPALHGRKENV